jgi:2'-5' RNA ligase
MESVSRQWRLFCAIDIPSQVREPLAQHIVNLREKVPEASATWNRPENIHLTIKFIGEVTQPRADDLSQAASRAVAGMTRFEFEVGGAGSFPKQGLPKVLWIGIGDSSRKLSELYKRLEEECTSEGFSKEQREFHPHLTVARLRKSHGARTLAAAHKEQGFPSLIVPVLELLVIRSELSSQGSKYTVISRHPLT